MLGQLVLEQEPATFPLAAVVDRVHHLVVVVVVDRPLHADRVAVVDGGNGHLEVPVIAARFAVGAGLLGQRLIAHALLHRDLVKIRGHILGQVVEPDPVQARRGIAGVQNGFPLNESGGRELIAASSSRLTGSQALQLRSGVSTLPLRSAHPAFPAKFRPAPREKMWASKTSLS